MGYTPHILVIGGGVMGTGIARDFAIRGLDVTLVERGTLASGATDRSQGLLYSGARVADSNPELARHCLAENRKLRGIAGNCIEPTNGLLVTHQQDDDETFERCLSAAQECDIPVEVLDGDATRDAEPGLSAGVQRAMRVPDAVVDQIRLTIENAKSAGEYGAEVRTHTTVTDIAVDGGTLDTVTLEHDPSPPGGDEDDNGNRDENDTGDEDEASDGADESDHVTDGGRRDGSEDPHYKPEGTRPGGPPAGVPGALLPGQSSKGEQLQTQTEELEPDYVVNAAGAWAETVTELADITLSLGVSKETVAVAHGKQIDLPVTRCREQRAANTVVPSGDTCLLGTIQRDVEDPDECTGTVAEVDQLLDEIPAIVPEIRDCRVRRSDCSVQSWYTPADGESEQSPIGLGDVRKDSTLLDHGDRDDCWGMTTVVGGSVTTHRLVAERVVDDVCRKFGITRGCRTDEIPLPGAEDTTQEEPPGAGTHGPPDPVVCECQSVTRADVREAINAESSTELDLNEIRLRTTASMGACQGGRCVHRLAAQLYPDHDEETVEDVLTALLDERWQGQRPTLWGDQLARAMANYAFHARTLHRKSKDVDFRAEQPDHTGATEEGPQPSSESFRLDAFDDGPSRDTGRAHSMGGGRSV